MAKRQKFKNPVQPIRPDLKAKFLLLIGQGKEPKCSGKIAGFKTKNTNAMWRWDSLEDVN